MISWIREGAREGSGLALERFTRPAQATVVKSPNCLGVETENSKSGSLCTAHVPTPPIGHPPPGTQSLAVDVLDAPPRPCDSRRSTCPIGRELNHEGAQVAIQAQPLAL